MLSISLCGYGVILGFLYNGFMKLIKQIFKEVNNDIFGGTLDTPEFICLHDGEHFGWFYCDENTCTINVNPVYCYDYNTIFGTIAHEMCHYADWVFYKSEWNHLTHDGKFSKMTLEIEKFYNLEKGTI